MGASGILGNFLAETGKKQFLSNTTFFLFGLFFAPFIIGQVDFISTSIGPKTNLTENVLVITLAGFAVGVGTKMAGGCTSGHGVCGISRLSIRSITATIVFVSVGILTVSILKYWLAVI